MSGRKAQDPKHDTVKPKRGGEGGERGGGEGGGNGFRVLGCGPLPRPPNYPLIDPKIPTISDRKGPIKRHLGGPGRVQGLGLWVV